METFSASLSLQSLSAEALPGGGGGAMAGLSHSGILWGTSSLVDQCHVYINKIFEHLCKHQQMDSMRLGWAHAQRIHGLKANRDKELKKRTIKLKARKSQPRAGHHAQETMRQINLLYVEHGRRETAGAGHGSWELGIGSIKDRTNNISIAIWDDDCPHGGRRHTRIGWTEGDDDDRAKWRAAVP